MLVFFFGIEFNALLYVQSWTTTVGQSGLFSHFRHIKAKPFHFFLSSARGGGCSLLDVCETKFVGQNGRKICRKFLIFKNIM